MRYILIILSLLLLSSPLFGQSSKTLGVVLPPTIKGEISDTQIKFLLITLDDALSKYFAVSPPPQIESGECLAGCDYFQLQIAEEDGYPQLSLRWKSGNYSRIETKLCVGCNTTELNEKLKELVENLVGGKKGEKVLVVEKKRKGLLFLRLVNGEYRWFEDGDEDKDGKFEGEIENGLAHGLGTFTWSDGNKYEGEWKNGEINGQGTLTLTSGNKYEGEFKDWKYHSRGTFTWSNGDKYEGEFKDGVKHGQGTFTSPGGKSYEGKWQDGNYHGQGTYTFGKGKWEGDKYIGEYKNGKKDGQGTYTFSDGRKYEGEFREGTFWNITEYDKNGNIIGNYVNGVKQ